MKKQRRPLPAPVKKLTAKGQKPPEAKPPAKFIRTMGGMPAELRRTKFTTNDGRWLYRLWFGDVTGNSLFTVEQLQEEGVTWETEHPPDLRPRREEPLAVAAPDEDT